AREFGRANASGVALALRRSLFTACDVPSRWKPSPPETHGKRSIHSCVVALRTMREMPSSRRQDGKKLRSLAHDEPSRRTLVGVGKDLCIAHNDLSNRACLRPSSALQECDSTHRRREPAVALGHHFLRKTLLAPVEIVGHTLVLDAALRHQ